MKGEKIYNKTMGAVQLVLGGGAVLYILLWLTGVVVWSRDVVFIPMAIFGVVNSVSGVMRLRLGRPLFRFKAPWLNTIARAVFAFGCALVVITQGLIVSGCFERYDGEADYAVVLGARVHGDVPSMMFYKRIMAAADYLNAHPDVTVIACGGYPGDGDYSEAQVCAAYLANAGIDPARIIIEDQSSDTSHSARNASAIIESRGGAQSVVVISSDYHLFRSKRLFEGYGYTAFGVGSSVAAGLRPIAHFREMLSIIRDLLYSVVPYLGQM